MELFGSRLRTQVLLFIALSEETYPREIAASLEADILSVQRIVADFERLGVLASRLRGRLRILSLDRTWFAAAELRSLLERLAVVDETVQRAVSSMRRRPRRTGKPL
jgi:hypothetical protein